MVKQEIIIVKPNYNSFTCSIQSLSPSTSVSISTIRITTTTLALGVNVAGSKITIDGYTQTGQRILLILIIENLFYTNSLYTIF